MLFDSHAHLDAFAEDGTLAAMLDRARAAGVVRLVAIGGRAEANALAVASAAGYPGMLYAAVGFDRDQAGAAWDEDAFEALLSRPETVAVGETGLDYHYTPETAPAQRVLFEKMAAAAASRRLPLVVHTREAEADTHALLGAHARGWKGDPGRLGVIHCFTGTTAFAGRMLDLGYHISISGIATFPRGENVRAAAAYVPADRLLIETDAPYLAPVPHRGRRNEPAFLAETARAVADVRGIPCNELADLTRRNAERLFGLMPADN